MTMTLQRKTQSTTRTTNSVSSPPPNSARKRPKFVSHAGHSVARHMFDEMSQRLTRIQCVSTMQEHRVPSSLLHTDAFPCPPNVDERVSYSSLTRLPIPCPPPSSSLRCMPTLEREPPLSPWSSAASSYQCRRGLPRVCWEPRPPSSPSRRQVLQLGCFP